MAETEDENQLERLLQAAALEDSAAAALFYQALLQARLYAPCREGARDSVVGTTDTFAASGLLAVSHQGDEIVPLFTQASFIEKWAGRELPFVHQDFRAILWLVRDGMSIHLNAGQEFGKEITPWEIERLREGAPAIPELVAELTGTPAGEIEVNSDPGVYPELKVCLGAILEVYSEIEEAFLVEIKEEDSAPAPLLGLRRTETAAEKLALLKEELIDNSRAHLAGPLQLIIVDDLDSGTNPQARLFDDAVPFYIAQRSYPFAAAQQGLIDPAVNNLKNKSGGS